MVKLKKFQELFQEIQNADDNDPEKQWLLDHAKTAEVKAKIAQARNFTHSELAILSALAETETALAFKDLQDQSTLSQGMLSRYVDRLAKQGLVEKFHAPENQKAVLLRATDTGAAIGTLHVKLHQVQQKRYKEMIGKYSRSEQETVVKFLTDFLATRNHL